MGHHAISAVILSAGTSSRMGKHKPMMRLGGSTVIERVVDTFGACGIEDIRVVIGFRSEDMIPLLEGKKIQWVLNRDYQEEMLGSVKLGVEQLHYGTKAFFILPVDIPLVRSQTLRLLVSAFKRHPRAIIYPVFSGERGHPPLIPMHYSERLLGWSGKDGLRGFLRQHGHEAVDTTVFDEGILMDMDGPEDYRKLLNRYENRHVPSISECEAIMHSRFPKDHPVQKHGRAVAQVAGVIGAILRGEGYPIDVDLMIAAGRLHDMGKGEKDHAAYGAGLLERMGFERVADIIRSHMDLSAEEMESIAEKQILYLADKIVDGDQMICLDKRMRKKRKSLVENPDGTAVAESRIRNAMKIKKIIEKIIGKTVESLFSD